ncbi:hypothetical protein COSO111634_25175 [Corallococcus soli]
MASASSWAKSKRSCASCPPCVRPSSSSARTSPATSVSSPTSCHRPVRRPPPLRTRATSSSSSCLSTWCPPPLLPWRPCPSPSMASWIARPCRLLGSRAWMTAAPTLLRALPPSSSSLPSGVCCWALLASALATTSSSWAATPCSPPRSSPASAPPSASTCPSAPSSSLPPSNPSRPPSTPSRARGSGRSFRPSGASTGPAHRRCPSPSSGSGSWISSSPTARCTTCPRRCAWKAHSTRRHWSRASRNSCAVTKSCAPHSLRRPSSASRLPRPCRWSAWT